MSEFNISIESGTSKRLPVGNKWSEKDIIVTATGGTEDLNDVLTEQDTLIAELKDVLKGKAAGGGGGEDFAKSIVERTITEYSNHEIKTVGTRAFSHCKSLISVDLPEVTTVGQHGFNSCSELERVVFPKLTTLNPGDNFTYCSVLKYADLGFVTNLPSWSLANTALETVILRKSDKICTLQTTNALSGTPIAKGTGYVYVPKALVENYKSATNWSTYAEQIRAIEDYPDITGG